MFSTGISQDYRTGIPYLRRDLSLSFGPAFKNSFQAMTSRFGRMEVPLVGNNPFPMAITPLQFWCAAWVQKKALKPEDIRLRRQD